jgi:hypothetical protein
MRHPVFTVFASVTLFASLLMAGSAQAASPSAEQALKLAPTQEGIDYDTPKPEDTARCKISAKKLGGGASGWVVEAPDGTVLRRFADTNNDNVVDQWSYFKDGVEVYRDIDSKFTGRADQFRWFHTAGTRWGLDLHRTGKVEVWKVLSAEEAAAEVVAALSNRDPARFLRVLLTNDELQSLGLGKTKTDALAAKITKAETDFRALAMRDKTFTADSKFVQFSGNKPGTVPAGTDDSARDLHVYENVVAIAQTGERHQQLQIGTLVQVGDVWKVIDAPLVLPEGQPEVAGGGFFFQASPASRPAVAAAGTNDEGQKLLSELEKLDKAGERGPRRAELIERLAQLARTPEDRAMWFRQLADMISGDVQSGKSTDGDKRLQALFDKLQKSDADRPLAGYVKFRQLMAAYGLALQAPKADVTKIQAEWLKNLEKYTVDYPNTPDAAEAMLQLGMAREFAGQDDDAKKWYDRITHEFAESPAAKKAAGASLRLDCVGKAITFSGKSLRGENVDIAKERGNVVILQYWATWSARSKSDMAALKQAATKFGSSLTIVSVSLDNNVKDLEAYLGENRLSWPQVFEEGGLDSRPANQLGILTVPTMLLIDQQGKVVSRNLQISDVETEVKKLLK